MPKCEARQQRKWSTDIPGAKHRSVAIRDGTLHFVEAGEGAALLLVHGGHGSWTQWLANIGPLARFRRVIAVDLPGFGASYRPEPDYTFAHYGEVVSQLLDALDIDRAAIAGFSFGSIVATFAAQREPERIERVVLVNAPGIGPSSPVAATIMKELTSLSLGKGLRAGAHASLRRLQLYDHTLIDEPMVDRMIASLRMTRIVTRDLSSVARTDLVLPGIAQRLGIFIGREDVHRQFGLAEGLAAISRAAPHAQVWLVERAAHWLQCDRAAFFNAAMADFLG